MKKLFALIIVLWFFVIIPCAWAGVAPPNDFCADATTIFIGDTAFSNVGATTEGVCGGSDIWYKYTATCTGYAIFSICNMADYDAQLGVYDGSDCMSALAGTSSLGCSDDCVFTSQLTVPVVVGQGYLVEVGGFGGDQGSGTLRITSCEDLYAVDGAGCTLSNLYKLDPSDGSVDTTIGPIEVGMTQLRHVTGIAIHPATGVMYGVVNDNDFINSFCDYGNATLITIDKTNGDATVIGSTGEQIPDISFDPFGTLYAWSESEDDLFTINLATGAATGVGECFCSTAFTGLAVDSMGAMYMKDYVPSLHRMNPGTGTIVSDLFLNDTPHNLLAFDQNDVLFTGKRNSSTSFTLQTINLNNGTVTDIGSNDKGRISAIEFDRGVLTPPDVADLSLTKIVDTPNPAIGSNVTFTITVSNGGPDGATGVEVTDLLPSGFSYFSDNGMGAYNSGTGVWTVGSISNSSSESLDIVATVLSTGNHLNTAEVTASNEFDPDSIPDDNIPTEDDQDSVNPSLDGAVDVIVSGQTNASGSKKTFAVKVINQGLESFVASVGILDVQVFGSDSFVTCSGQAKTLSTGRMARFHCTFNPSAAGVSPGNLVTYSATLNLIGDVDPGDNMDSESQTAN